MHTNSKLAFESEVLPLIEHGWKVLDVGAPRGRKGYQSELITNGCEYWYSDLSNKGRGAKINWLDEYRMDCPDNEFDAVVTAQTLEHVKKIWLWFPELARVVKPGGIVASISPTTWAEHRYPVDCWRILPDGGIVLLEQAGLDPIKSVMLSTSEGDQDAKYQMSGTAPVYDLVIVGRKPASRRYDFGDHMLG